MHFVERIRGQLITLTFVNLTANLSYAKVPCTCSATPCVCHLTQRGKKRNIRESACASDSTVREPELAKHDRNSCDCLTADGEQIIGPCSSL